ncbi:MAG: aryl-sulfate sulfohydrolase [Verrucomicrobiales bacterium]|nr:aryl-sulfate sulfohydrolase [Verrucomicrobiales bacterium]
MRSVCLFLSLLICGSFVGAEESRPNLLFIYLDDFGWRDTGYMGSDFYETPNIDALAAGGMVFTNAYSAAANCAPARACLLSGQYTPRHEIYNVGTGPRGKAEHRRLKHIPGVDTLDSSITTWAHCLQEAGYVTASMGKWHLSKTPCDFGFDINVGGSHSGSPPRGYYPPHPGAPGLKDADPDEYLTDTLSNRASSFIRENQEKPWALYLTHFAVHTPIEGKKELLGKYKEKPPGKLHQNVEMGSMIEAVDQGVGEIVKALEESGSRERTIIVFYSDNGGYGPATDMDPLKGYKGTYYEGGIRVPFFVNWHGVVEGGQTSDWPIIGVDLYPTFCEMLGAELPEAHPLDGVSLVPLLKGQEEVDLGTRALFWHFPAYLQSYGKINGEQRDPLFRSRPCSIVRKGNWKLHEYFEDGAFELYDLSADPGEKVNLIEEEPEVFQRMRAELEAWRSNIGAPVPSEPNPEFDVEEERRAIEKAKAR